MKLFKHSASLNQGAFSVMVTGGGAGVCSWPVITLLCPSKNSSSAICLSGRPEVHYLCRYFGRQSSPLGSRQDSDYHPLTADHPDTPPNKTGYDYSCDLSKTASSQYAPFNQWLPRRACAGFRQAKVHGKGT